MAKTIGEKTGVRDSEEKPQSGASRFRQCTGPDCSWSWVVAVACSFQNFFTFAMVKSGAVVFLKTLEHHDVSRGAASWPVSLINAVCMLSGMINSLFSICPICMSIDSIITVMISDRMFIQNA